MGWTFLGSPGHGWPQVLTRALPGISLCFLVCLIHVWWCFPCVFPIPGRDVMEGGKCLSFLSGDSLPWPWAEFLPPPRARREDPEPSFLFLQSLQHCQKGKGTIWLALVYCTPCQFELINHIYPSILITPCLATCLALSC